VKAVVLQEGHKFGLEDVPEPKLQKNDDVMVQVTAAAICGSDLHIMHGLIPGIPVGTIIGHEFVGKIVELGSDVTRFKTGERVAVRSSKFRGSEREACFGL
jgi:threonine dehydrogenase-like Zn-dependent dehydrogenase